MSVFVSKFFLILMIREGPLVGVRSTDYRIFERGPWFNKGIRPVLNHGSVSANGAFIIPAIVEAVGAHFGVGFLCKQHRWEVVWVIVVALIGRLLVEDGFFESVH